MPRYFFHSADGAREYDREGMELPDLAAARHEAVVFAGEVLKFKPDQVWNGGHWRAEVTDQAGHLLFTVITVAIDAPVADEEQPAPI